MISQTNLRMTMEQAAALRVILKLEFVGKTGHLLKHSKDKEDSVVLAQVVRNTEIWSQLDAAVAHSMAAIYRQNEATLDATAEVVVPLSGGMLEVIQGIIKKGEYLQTLDAAKSTQQAQITIGAMVHVVTMDRCLDDLKRILGVSDKPEMVFYPMPADKGRMN